MAGKKGSSPNVYKYYKVDGDKITQELERFVQDVEKVCLCQNTKTDTLVVNVV